MSNTKLITNTQPCCILSHLDPSRTRLPLPGFCEHGVCCTAHSKTESAQNVVTSKTAVGEVYDTRDAKTVLGEIKKEIEEAGEGEWPRHLERSVGPG
jgi:hypothetical protein